MSYHTMRFPAYGMTNASNFKWGFTPDSNPKMGNIRTLIHIKAPRLNNSVISYRIVFSEYGKANASISSVGLPLRATQKLVKKGVTKLVFIYIKEPRWTSLTWRNLCYSEYGLINASILILPLPLTATQKWLNKRGNTNDMYLCYKAMLKPVSYRTLGFQSTEWPMEAILRLP